MTDAGRVHYRAVKAQVAKCMEAEGWCEGHLLITRVGQALGLGPDWPGMRLAGQVRRVADQLTEEGALVKIGRGCHHPGGAYENATSYYTPDAYIAAHKRAAKEEAERRADRKRWDAVRQDLETCGYRAGGVPGEPVVLDLETWERLVCEALR